MPFIRTSQIEDEYIYVPQHHLSNVRTNRRSRRSISRRPPQGTGMYQWAVLVLAVLSIVTCFFVIVAGFFFSEISRFPMKNVLANPAIACLDCTDEDYIPHHLLEEVSRKHADGVDQCCAYNTKELTALLEISMRRRPVKSALPAFNVSSFSLSPVSAHVQLLAPVIDKADDNNVTFMNDAVTIILKDENNKNINRYDHVRKIDLLQDGFKVKRSGLYYLYSSINFHISSNTPCSDLKFKVWQHYIEITSKSKKFTLFKTTYTCCDDCAVTNETSYTGGTVRLMSDDIISIKISGYGLAFFDPTTSFAGLMMMGDGD